jgi:hypothetical protein
MDPLMVHILFDLVKMEDQRTHQNTEFIIQLILVQLEQKGLFIVDRSDPNRFKVSKTLTDLLDFIDIGVARFSDLFNVALEVTLIIDKKDDLMGDLLRDRCRKKRGTDLIVQFFIQRLRRDTHPLDLIARRVGDMVLVIHIGFVRAI